MNMEPVPGYWHAGQVFHRFHAPSWQMVSWCETEGCWCGGRPGVFDD